MLIVFCVLLWILTIVISRMILLKSSEYLDGVDMLMCIMPVANLMWCFITWVTSEAVDKKLKDLSEKFFGDW